MERKMAAIRSHFFAKRLTMTALPYLDWYHTPKLVMRFNPVTPFGNIVLAKDHIRNGFAR